MIGTNTPTNYVKLFDGRVFAIISDNPDDATYDVIPVRQLCEDGSYDAESIITREYGYDTVQHKYNDLSLL